MSWLKRGYDELEKKDKEMEDRRSNTAYRFWIPSGNTTKIIFVDDNPPIIGEHQLKINGDWKNWHTCPASIDSKDECGYCKAGDRPYSAAFYTIIDMTEWTDKKGVKHANEKKLFVAKQKTWNKLKMKSRKYKQKEENGLVYVCFDVSRSSSDASSVGDDFEFVKRYTEQELKAIATKGDITPFDYEKILKPKGKEDVMRTLAKTDMGNDDTDDYQDEEDIKF